MIFRVVVAALLWSLLVAAANQDCHVSCFHENDECEAPCLSAVDSTPQDTICFATCELKFKSCAKTCNAENTKKSSLTFQSDDMEDSRELWKRRGPTIVSGGLGNFTIVVKHDLFPEETGWTFKQTRGGSSLLLAQVTGSVTNQSEVVVKSVNLTKPGRYRFYILDSEGDGICCFYGRGYWDAYANGTLVFAASGRFLFQQSVWFDLY
jgi:hypothetical protein